jgi:hypothetical protein
MKVPGEQGEKGKDCLSVGVVEERNPPEHANNNPLVVSRVDAHEGHRG